MKERELSDRDAHYLTIQLFDAGAIGVLEIPKVIKEWRQPRHPHFAAASKSVWRLFNAATEVIKGDLWRLPARTRAAHHIIDGMCGAAENGNGAPHVEPATAELAV